MYSNIFYTNYFNNPIHANEINIDWHFTCSASMSPYAKRMTDYITAESAGKEDGECWRYYKDCPKSLFGINEGKNNKYT